MTLLELIQKHELKVGDKIKVNGHSYHYEILYLGTQSAFVKNGLDGREDIFLLQFNTNWELYTEPKVPLSLDASVIWNDVGPLLDYAFVEKLKPFKNKKVRMVLTEIIEEES